MILIRSMSEILANPESVRGRMHSRKMHFIAQIKLQLLLERNQYKRNIKVTCNVTVNKKKIIKKTRYIIYIYLSGHWNVK